MSDEAGGVGDDRVAAVQDADLHVLERGDVGDELGADLLEERGGRRGAFLDHPLDEVLAETGQASSMPNWSRAIARSRSEVAGAMRSTMRVGEGDVPRIQAASSGSCASARPATAFCATTPLCGILSQDMHGEGRDAGGAAGAEPGEDQAEDGLRRVGVGGVGGDRRVLRVERAGRGIDEVAALGDGQRDDAGGGMGELLAGWPRRPSAAGSRSSRR